MSYTLRTGITRGRIDAGDLGTHEIRNGTLECTGYETAAALVERYSHVNWSNGDPEDGDTSEDSEDSEASFEERVALAEALVQESWQSITSDVKAGEADEFLERLKKEEKRRADRNETEPRGSVISAIEERREEING